MKNEDGNEDETGETLQDMRRDRFRESSAADEREENISIHIFSASATMVGVCLTGIGLFRVLDQLKNVNSLADNLLALDALGFLASCLLSYASLRSRDTEKARKIEKLADRLFLAALGLMTIISGLIAYEIA